MKYCCFTCLVEKFIVKSFGIFLFCYKKGILVASWEEKTVCWNGFELMEHVLAPVFWIVGDTDRLWKYSNHLDIPEAETTQTNFFSSNQLVCCWFTCGIVDHPSFYRSIWSIFDNCRHGIPPCWRFHSVSFHLHPWRHFCGEDVCLRLALSSQNFETSCLHLCYCHTMDHGNNNHCFTFYS